MDLELLQILNNILLSFNSGNAQTSQKSRKSSLEKNGQNKISNNNKSVDLKDRSADFVQ
jgi:hypothetical protein